MKDGSSNFIIAHTNPDTALIAALCLATIGMMWALIKSPKQKGRRISILESLFKKLGDGKISPVTLFMEIVAGIVCIVVLGEWFIHNENTTSTFDLVSMGIIAVLAILVSWRIVLWAILKDKTHEVEKQDHL
jgi:F0F1-type ATP synthase assembly protein I